MKSSTYVNYGNEETQTPKPLIPTEKHNGFGHAKLYGQKN